MKTEMITGQSIARYMQILTNEEIFGFNDNRFTLIGAYDEEKDRPAGVAVAHILPKYIRLERMFTDPEYRLQGVSEELLSIMTDLPTENKMPIYVYGDESEVNEEYLTKMGFKGVDNGYSYIIGTPDHLVDIKVPQKKPNIKVLPAEKVAPEKLENYIFSSRRDEFIQFPEGYLDMNRFSDASLVCMKDDKIDAVVMMEELTDCVQVTYVYGNSNQTLLYNMALIKKLLLDEFDGSMKLKFLICDGVGGDAIKRIFDKSEESDLKLFIWDEQIKNKN